MRKALFFDIDGTIIDENTGLIPESTLIALEKARENGHLTFINTGRTACVVPHVLLNLPFSGYLCGCGTYLSCEGKVIESHTIPDVLVNTIIEKIREAGMDGILEGTQDIYFQKQLSKNQLLNQYRLHFQSFKKGVT